MNKITINTWLIVLLVTAYLITCVAVSYNAIVSAQPQYIIPNIYFRESTPIPTPNDYERIIL